MAEIRSGICTLSHDIMTRNLASLLLLTLALAACDPPPGTRQPAGPAGPTLPAPPPGADPTAPASIVVVERTDRLEIETTEIRVVVERAPWRLRVVDIASGQEVLAEDAGGRAGVGQIASWGRLGFGVHIGFQLGLYHGYHLPIGLDAYWAHADRVTAWRRAGGRIELDVSTDDPFGRGLRVALDDFRTRRFTLSAEVAGGGMANRIGMTFRTPADEAFFGFGERFSAVNHRGNVVRSVTEEGGFSAGALGSRTSLARYPKDATYVPIPFFLSSLGHGLELDTFRLATFDMAAGRPDRYRFEVESRRLDVTFHLGRTPAETLEMFTARRGRSLIPPRWAFGPWNQMSNMMRNIRPTATKFDVAREFVRLDIPSSFAADYLHFFPQGRQIGREAQVRADNDRMHALGLKSGCYFNPYVGVDHPTLFAEGKARGHLVARKDGRPYVFRYMNFEAAQVDFTSPAAIAWYQAQIQGAIDLGFDGWMYDFGEYTPHDSVFADGRRGIEVRNEYPLLYQKAVFDLLAGHDPVPGDAYAPDFVPYVRSGSTGSQRWTWAHWTGDPTTDWSYADGLPAQIAAGLSIGLSGMPISGSDIGGFTWYAIEPPDRELLLRWYALGVMSGLMRDQTGGFGWGPRTQIFDWPDGPTILRRFQKLRTALFPYIYTLAHEAHERGLPLMRHHVLHFPGDPEALRQTYQYLFGDRILVAPIVDPGRTDQAVYLPAGEEWIDVGSTCAYDEADGRFRIAAAARRPGGQHVTVAAPLDRIPFFVRAGTILATLDPTVDTLADATDPGVTDLADREHLLHLWCWPDATGRAATTVWDGARLELTPTALTVSDPNGRTIVAQVALGPAGPPATVSGDGSGPLPRRGSWKDLVATGPVGSAWAWDATAGVLWLRLEPGDRRADLGR